MSIIKVNKLNKTYKYSVKDENKGVLDNVLNSKEKEVKAVNNISLYSG